MASSQVEIATSSPFVHSRRDPACFQNRGPIEFADLWVHRPRWQTPAAAADNDTNQKSGSLKPDKWAKAREMVFNVDPASTPGGAAGLAEISNLGGVSSLLQKWRGFEANRSKAGPTPGTGAMDNIAAASAEPPTPTPTPSPSPSLYEDVDSFLGDWEPDRAAAVSRPPPSRRRDSMAIDIERLKVSDIVKRLTVNDVACDSPPRYKVASSDQPDQQRCPSTVVNSPRIRGRQALNDLLMQIERDRYKELEGIVARKPVSSFPHRGRIQALLRFRFLRRGMEAKEDCHSNDNSSQTQKAVKRLKPSALKGSAIPDCCHKEVVDNTCTAKNVQIANQCVEATDSKRCPEKKTDRIHDSEGSLTSNQHDNVGQSSQKVKEATHTSVRLCHSYENLGHAANPFSALLRKRDDWENDNHKQLAKSAGNEGPFHSAGINFGEKTKSYHTIDTTCVHDKEEKDTNHHQVTINNFEELSSYHKDEQTQELVDTASMYWVSDHASNTEVEWDELQSDNQLEEQEGSNTEWMYQVSRPRSDWEGLRQERYQEMLDHFLDNEEIRVLLGRRNVSTFLSSNLREKIEQVMVSRTQGRVQQTPKNDRTQEKEKRDISLSEQVGVSDEQDKGEDYNDINFDEYEEAYESSVGQQYNNESDDCTDQITTSSWPQNQSIDYSYHHIPSPSPFPSTQQSPSNFYSQNSSRRPNSSDSAHPSAIDMELIYDLRGHMEQLHQEMSELRKTIKCCVDMQINLQLSIKKEVATALYSEAKNGQRNPVKKVTSTSGSTGGMCCVCRKMPIDSLLYRCGHMCTCFKCAHKLHWSSGKCPICRAPILDVVRTYSNHS